MIGWFFHPHGPEESVVKRVYLELAIFIESVGTDKFHESRHRMMSVLNESDETLTIGYIPWQETEIFKRLYLLNNHANKIFIYIIDYFFNAKEQLPPELGKMVRAIANSFHHKEKEGAYKGLFQPREIDEDVSQLFAFVYDADALMNEPVSKINQAIQISKLSTKTIFGGAFDKNSIVFITALRFGFMTSIAAIIAFEFELERSYWVPLSCVAVMSGATIMSTHHRAIQRGIGTFIGIIIASLILAMEPTGYILAFFILMLTFITELFIVKNYGLAAMFFTPNALLMAESTSEGSFSFTYFASARMLDVMIGIVIGLIGVWLIGRKSASSRIPHLITKTIRAQAQFLLVLFSEQGDGFHARKSKELKKMRINLENLKTMYHTAAGEIPVNREVLDYYWPVIYSIENVSYLLEDCSKMEKRPILSDQVLSQLLYACEMTANAASQKRSPSIKNIPEIEGFPSIQRELINLEKALK
jgi:uncharacterized membrane protein YccC